MLLQVKWTFIQVLFIIMKYAHFRGGREIEVRDFGVAEQIFSLCKDMNHIVESGLS